MNRTTIVGIVIGAVLATGVAAVAGYRAVAKADYADVVRVEAITKTVRTPRESCRDDIVTLQEPVKDEKRITGSVVGAVVGGVLGSQVGSGSGRDIATVAGAAAGGYAGNKTQERIQDKNTYQTTQRRCETVYDSHKEEAGYNVTYRLDGKENVVRMDHNPGARIPVKDSQLQLQDSRT